MTRLTELTHIKQPGCSIYTVRAKSKAVIMTKQEETGLEEGGRAQAEESRHISQREELPAGKRGILLHDYKCCLSRTNTLENRCW